MSEADIPAELPKPSAQARSDPPRLEGCTGPTDDEKALLDAEQAVYDANPAAGTPWPEVEKRLRRRIA